MIDAASSSTATSPRGSALVATIGLALAVAALLALMLSALGSRWGFWDFRTGFTVMKWAVYGALAAAVVSLAGVLVAAIGGRPGLVSGVLGLAVAGLAAGVPLAMLHRARTVPAIHDISTDTENPPSFVAILPLRANALNPVAYGGAEIAAQQKKAYPDVAPLHLALAPAAAFDRALAAARAMGWEIVATAPAEGRIEATDTTFWFGFQDDVVVRVAADGSGSRVDVRSLSRVGKSDVGKNAERVRAYLSRLARGK